MPKESLLKQKIWFLQGNCQETMGSTRPGLGIQSIYIDHGQENWTMKRKRSEGYKNQSWKVKVAK